MFFFSALPSITLRKETLPSSTPSNEQQQQQIVDEDFEMDIDQESENSPTKTKTKTENIEDTKIDKLSLDGVDNLKTCTGDQLSFERNNKFTKYCSSQQLADETERTFKCITNFTLREKLAVTNQDHNSNHVTMTSTNGDVVDSMAMHTMTS